MTNNMANWDRIARIVVAIVIGALYFMGVIEGTLAIALGVLAGIFLVTSLIGFCPLYMPFKFSTKK